MNTQQLQCFVCVADKLNFTKAAEELYLSTPTVTHHIKNLEEELKAKLFIRTSRMVKLTREGTAFYSDAREILDKIHMSKKRMGKTAEQDVTFFRIGCSSQGELNRLQSVLPELQKAYPQVYPQIIIEDFFKVKSMFHKKQIDIMFATKEVVKDMRDCKFKKIKDARNFAIVPESSPFRFCQSLDFDQLGDTCLIMLHPKFIPFRFGNQLQEKITLHSHAHFDIVCDNDQTAILLAKSGYGVAILPEFCIPDDRGDLITIPVSGDDAIEYGLAYQREAKESWVGFFVDFYTQ